jgi:hypothetical protein
VYAIIEIIGLDLPETVTEKVHNKKLNWLHGSQDGIRYCLLNRTGGKGVDMFCALPLADGSGGVCLYNAQQKVEAAALGAGKASTLLEKAKVLPRCLSPNSCCVRGLFSILASFNQDQETLAGRFVCVELSPARQISRESPCLQDVGGCEF